MTGLLLSTKTWRISSHRRINIYPTLNLISKQIIVCNEADPLDKCLSVQEERVFTQIFRSLFFLSKIYPKYYHLVYKILGLYKYKSIVIHSSIISVHHGYTIYI